MKGKLIIDGNAIYEIDEECMRSLKKKKDGKTSSPAHSAKSRKR